MVEDKGIDLWPLSLSQASRREKSILTNRYLTQAPQTLNLYRRFRGSGTMSACLFVRDGRAALLCWFRSPLGGEPYPSRGRTYCIAGTYLVRNTV